MPNRVKVTPLPPDQRVKLTESLSALPCTTEIRFPPGKIIFDNKHPAKNLYLIHRGRVKLAALSGGQSIIVRLLQPDDFFADECLLMTPLDNVSRRATTIDSVECLSWPADIVRAHIHKSPELSSWFLQISICNQLEAEQRLLSLSSHRVENRLADALIGLAERAEMKTADGWQAIPPMTHETIAEYIGTSREIVTLTLTKLRRAKTIQYSRAQILIKPEKLEALKRA